MRTTVALLCLLVTATSANGQNEAVGSLNGTIYAPFNQDSGLASAVSAANTAMQDCRMNVTPYIMSSPTVTPSITLLDFISVLQSNAGALQAISHGNASSFAAEVYEYSTAGRDSALSMLNHVYYPAGFTTSEVGLARSVNNTGWAITAKSALISRYANSGVNRLVFNVSCEGHGYGSSWNARFVGSSNTTSCSISGSNTFWNRMKGDGTIQQLAAGEAISGTSYLATGNGATVIRTAIVSTSMSAGSNLNQPTDVLFNFNANMSTSSQPAAGDYWIAVGCQTWVSPSQLKLCLVPIHIGMGTVLLSAWVCTTPSGFPLNGGNSTGLALNATAEYDNPAATVDGFSVIETASGRTAEWQVTDRARTDSFRVEAATDPAGPWTAVGTTPGVAGQNSLDIPAGFTHYRLVEVEKSGKELFHGQDTAGPRATLGPGTTPSREFLLGQLVELALERQAQALPGPAEQVAGSGYTFVVYCPTAWMGSARTYYADYWSLYGYQTSVVDLTSFPSEPVEFGPAIAADILARSQNTILHVLILADANDWRWYGGPQTDDVWVGDWPSIRADQIASGIPDGGQPSHDVLHLAVLPDSLPRGMNTAYTVPYGWSPDLLTAGSDNVVVGILPFNDESEVLAYAVKMQQENTGLWYGVQRALWCIGDVDFDTPDDGQQALAIAQAARGTLADATWTQLLQSDILSDSERNVAAAAMWNSVQPDIVGLSSSWSSRYQPGRFFDLANAVEPWTMDRLNENVVASLVLAGSCSSADVFRTENAVLGTPASHRFLSAWDRGALAWAGPTVGTWQAGNAAFVQAYLAELTAHPERPMCRSFWEAKRAVYAAYADQPEVLRTVQYYVFLGDPVSRINTHLVPTDIAGSAPRYRFSLQQNSPNPFNPATQIAFTLSQGGPVTLSVYDVTGRLVRTLVRDELPAGLHRVAWSGTDLASGV
ncbi:MAG: hypothetical protein HY341_00005, partial [Candidatus Kerfeldbacteria bacterium]|nr:hypothetical protein [Candidatus Kerfeldbacteria bacterium]